MKALNLYVLLLVVYKFLYIITQNRSMVGSIKSPKSPYISIFLSRQHLITFHSLQLILNSLTKLNCVPCMSPENFLFSQGNKILPILDTCKRAVYLTFIKICEMGPGHRLIIFLNLCILYE